MTGAGCGTITRPFRLKVVPAEAPAPRGARSVAAPFLWGEARPRDPKFLGSFRLAITAGGLPMAAAYREPPPPEPVEIGLYPEFRQAPLPIAAPNVPERLLPVIVEPGADDAPPVEAPLPIMPEAGFLPVELRCRNKAGDAWERPERDQMAVCPALPVFAVQAALVELRDLAAAKMGKVPLAEAAPVQHRKVSANTGYAIKALAAGLVMAISAWFGSGMRSPKPESARAEYAQSEEASRPALALEAARGPAGWVRNAMAQRAAAEYRDSFRDDAKSWQNAANGLPAGWARYPQGYVKTGPMALYGPSLGFTDYRFEFFGQIETEEHGVGGARPGPGKLLRYESQSAQGGPAAHHRHRALRGCGGQAGTSRRNSS